VCRRPGGGRAGDLVAAVHARVTRNLPRRTAGADEATVDRSRGAAIQQACAALPYYLHTYPLIVERSWHKLAALGVERRLGPVEAG
jgi:hypothetical protein